MLRLPGFILFISFLFTVSYQNGIAQDFKQAWDFINENQRDKAFNIVKPKVLAGTASVDEFLTYYFLMEFNGKEDEVLDFLEQVRKSDNPSAYLYALWFSEAVIGNNGTKAPHQLALLKTIVDDKTMHNTLRASAHYNLSTVHVRNHEFSKINAELAQVGALGQWQFTGPFDNLSGSGFNKNYEPVQHPEPGFTFTSEQNVPIKWFTPPIQTPEGWTNTGYFIDENAGSINYAQTFVYSPVEQDIYLTAGFTGNIKVWVNDQIRMRVPEERYTEMDAYTATCHLNQGYNRILVQAGSDEDVANFIIRLTDKQYNALTNIKAEATYQPYKKNTSEAEPEYIPLFAETYFKEKIAKEPDNLVNYILLNLVYLRSKKIFEARTIVESAIKLAPKNSLLQFELALSILKEDNRTDLSRIYEYFEEHEKESLIGYEFRFQKLRAQEKYQEALDLLEEEIRIYGDDPDSYEDKIRLLGQLNQLPQLIATIEEACQKYPDIDQFASYKYNIELKVNKNPKKALKILEDYLATHYDYGLTKMLVQEYFTQQQVSKGFKVIQEQIDAWPFNPDVRLDIVREYFAQQRYAEALEVCEYMLKMKPYSGNYYGNKATVEEALNRTADAIKSYRNSLTYQPTLYESRDKLFKLEGKTKLIDSISAARIDELIPEAHFEYDTTEHDYYVIQDEATIQLYHEGGREEVRTAAYKILTERGIDSWSSFSLPYNSNVETIVIEDVQLIKSNGSKAIPETNENQIVCTGLEKNDIVYYRYRIKSYAEGKFAKEFYDHFIFQSYAPAAFTRYTMILPAARTCYYRVENGDVKPTVTEKDGFKIYSFEHNHLHAIKEESYMPPTSDIATTLHISTIAEWNEIANWYSDIVYSRMATDSDFEVNEVYKSLFPGKETLTADEKAKRIYQYLADNIAYSSVSFRQSFIVPQKASKTITSRLGDCKDISTLFVSLGRLSGLKSNLVLVSTRDYGIKGMLLPSFLFNHCIVRYEDEKGQEQFLELTDRSLPFKSLPRDLYDASSLIIPTEHAPDSKITLMPVNTSRKTPDKYVSRIKVEIQNKNMNMDVKFVRYGSLSSVYRANFRSISEEDARKELQSSYADMFVNPISISNISYEALDELVDSVSVKAKLVATNEVKKIGSVEAFTIPFFDVIFSVTPFTDDKRNHDFEYWSYENADEYESIVEVTIPAGKTFEELPPNQDLLFHGIHYTITYSTPVQNKVVVTRKVKMNRANIAAKDYAAFKEFATNILDIESSYISYK